METSIVGEARDVAVKDLLAMACGFTAICQLIAAIIALLLLGRLIIEQLLPGFDKIFFFKEVLRFNLLLDGFRSFKLLADD